MKELKNGVGNMAKTHEMIDRLLGDDKIKELTHKVRESREGDLDEMGEAYTKLVLTMLSMPGRRFRDLRSKAGDTLVLATEIACARNDHAFFIRLGRVLSRPQRTIGIPKIEAFLVHGWDESQGGLPQLRKLSAPVIRDICANLFSNNSLTPENIRKTIQRLGLKRSLHEITIRHCQIKKDSFRFW